MHDSRLKHDNVAFFTERNLSFKNSIEKFYYLIMTIEISFDLIGTMIILQIGFTKSVKIEEWQGRERQYTNYESQSKT